MIIRPSLIKKEKNILVEMLLNQRKVIAFLFEKIGIVNFNIALLQEIQTISHKAWQMQGFAISKTFISIVTEMLQEYFNWRTLKLCHGPYKNSWFLVKKKKKDKYKLINVTLDMNKVTIQDANFLSLINKFSKDFAGCTVAF